MPCFKGIAVSIHANAAPLAEYGLQKQSRVSRISTYIPVPSPQLNIDSGKHEPARFAISITLLTPGHPVPYTTPKSTDTNPYPKPLYAGPIPGSLADEGSRRSSSATATSTVTPYIPMTSSENETIAAYIYFDGRAKEEVATLLRPGEETWVNSRWVQVPDHEGGGLAEREFLFREVGLERWLNGLDLHGHDAAEKVEKRRQKFERRHRRQKSTPVGNNNGAAGTSSGGDHSNNNKSSASSNNNNNKNTFRKSRQRDTLAYGSDEQNSMQDNPDHMGEGNTDSDFLSADDDSDDDEPPEATGQIKVAMFRVIASGEIKKGEYSPQFDAHDDDDDDDQGGKGGSNAGGKGGSGGSNNSGAIDSNVEHTTSFAKPKTLDPKTISTQTVTGIDGPDKPYAVFTFFYRGSRQLSKMGILPSAKDAKSNAPNKRRSTQLDFGQLGPLKSTGTVGFTAFRDQEADAVKRRKSHKSRKSNGGSIDHGSNAMQEDTDDDNDDDEGGSGATPLAKMVDSDDKDVKTGYLNPEDMRMQNELRAGLDRIRLKRQHSAEPESIEGGSSYSRKSPSTGPTGEATPVEGSTSTSPSASQNPSASASAAQGMASLLAQAFSDDSPSTSVGSPLKKQRANDDQDRSAGFSPTIGDVLGRAMGQAQTQVQAQAQAQTGSADLNVSGTNNSSSSALQSHKFGSALGHPLEATPVGVPAVFGPKDESDGEL